MKTKILLPIAILFFTTTTVNAQINEGRYLLGGSVSYSNYKNQQASGTKLESFYSNIQFGKVIKDNIVAGIILSYSNSNNNYLSKFNQFSGGVFYRKYKPLAKNLYFFGEGDAVYTYSQNTSGHFQTGYDAQRYLSNGGALSFTPGISYSICKRMQVELSMPNFASISYAGTKNETTSSTNTTSISTVNGNNFSGNINLNSNLLTNFGIGFKFFLGK